MLHLLGTNVNDVPTLKRNGAHLRLVNSASSDVLLTGVMTVVKKLMANCFVGCVLKLTSEYWLRHDIDKRRQGRV